MEKYYLAYGSNLNLGQMKHRCPNAKLLGTAVISDYDKIQKKRSPLTAAVSNRIAQLVAQTDDLFFKLL